MPFDFTVTVYRQLLIAIKQSGYNFYTFEDWCDGKVLGKYVILRHDVDLKAINSLTIAKIEAELGIRATYYFRIVPQSNQPYIISSIAKLGHEIGYHYEDLALFHGDTAKAIAHFNLKLKHFRQFYPVRTICMHGSPTSKWDNRDLWKTYNYKDYGIIGEPYLDFLTFNPKIESDIKYFTDTARMWDGNKFNIRDKVPVNESELTKSDHSVSILPSIHSTFDLIAWLETIPVQTILMITTHPQRWTNNTLNWIMELLIQNLKNLIKKNILKSRTQKGK